MISTTWQTINGLRKAGGRLVYDGYGDRYTLVPDKRPVGKGVVTDLLERGYVRRVEGAPTPVYEITDKGRTAWARTPLGVTFSGVCDGCGICTTVRPMRLEWECIYLCEGCARRRAPEAAGGE